MNVRKKRVLNNNFFLLTKLLEIALIVEGGWTIESRDILNCSSILLTSDFLFVMVWILFLFWLIPLILSLSNLSCISFSIVYVGVSSCIFDFVAFIGIIKGCSEDLAEYDDDDDDDDKVEEKFEEKVDFGIDFDVSPIFLPRAKANKNWEIFVVCWAKCWW